MLYTPRRGGGSLKPWVAYATAKPMLKPLLESLFQHCPLAVPPARLRPDCLAALRQPRIRMNVGGARGTGNFSEMVTAPGFEWVQGGISGKHYVVYGIVFVLFSRGLGKVYHPTPPLESISSGRDDLARPLGVVRSSGGPHKCADGRMGCVKGGISSGRDDLARPLGVVRSSGGRPIRYVARPWVHGGRSIR